MQTTKDAENSDLKEQLRDLMFFIEAQQVISKTEDPSDIAGGTVTVGPPPETAKSKLKGKRRK